jgi:hypothetical protein
MKIIIILSIIYILSFLRMYFWTKNAYNKGGTIYSLQPDSFDICATLIPFLNTIMSIAVTFIFVSGKEKDMINISKFFRIKQ